MPDPVQHALQIVLDGKDLSEQQTAAAIGAVMDGAVDDVLVAALLTALRFKGESTAELVGAARAMRERAARIPSRNPGLLDTCGTGGDGLATFNISTAAALVAVAAGVPVAKHGNRAASSTSGSADVLEALGVNINLSPGEVAECIDEIGIGFCFAPLCHGAMKNVAPVRKRLGIRTIFNLLGPLTNPAGAAYQLVGAGRIETARRLAEALALLEPKRAVVVCGNDEVDEVSFWGRTVAFTVDGGKIREDVWENIPALAPEISVSPADLRVSSPAESAAMIRGALAPGEGNGTFAAARCMAAINAGAALYAAGHADSLEQGWNRACEVIQNGSAAAVLDRLVATTNRLAAAAQPAAPAASVRHQTAL